MKKTVDSLRGEVVFMLEKYGLLYEEISVNTTNDGLTIRFIRKNDTRKLQQFIHYLNAENLNYYAYFCSIEKRIKVNIAIE